MFAIFKNQLVKPLDNPKSSSGLEAELKLLKEYLSKPFTEYKKAHGGQSLISFGPNINCKFLDVAGEYLEVTGIPFEADPADLLRTISLCVGRPAIGFDHKLKNVVYMIDRG